MSEVDHSALIIESARHALALMKPRPAMSVSEWAEEHRIISKGVSAKPGRFHSFPYQIEPQESFRDPDVIETVLWWGARCGKTEMLLNLIGYCMTHDPMSILVGYPTEDSAEKFSTKFLTQMINSTPIVNASIADEKSRDGGNTILNKSFTGGTISMIGSNSPSKMRQIQAPLVVLDEIDAMLDGPEGDPVDLAFKRSDNYRNSINVSSSTGTRKGSSRIAARYKPTDQRNWFVPCIHCNHEFVILREHIDWQSVGEIEDPVIICPKCGHAHDDSHRQKIVEAGHWKANADFHGYRGYWLNAYNTLMPAKKGYNNRLHQFVAEYLRAKAKGSGSLMVYINTVDSELWEEKAEKIDEHTLSGLKQPYDHTCIPNGILWLCAAVDTQNDRFEADIWGFGFNDEAWHIQTKVILGDPDREETQHSLDVFLLGKWKREDGINLPLSCGFIDSGGNRTKAVYSFVRGKAARRIYAIKGVSSSNPFDNNVEVVKQSQSKKYRATLVMVHSAKLKKQFYDQLKKGLSALDDETEPKIHFNRDCDTDFFKSLVAEKLIRTTVNNKTAYKWRLDPSKGDYERNERLDNAVYARAARIQFQPDYAKIAESLKQTSEKVEPSMPPRTRKRSWATSY